MSDTKTKTKRRTKPLTDKQIADAYMEYFARMHMVDYEVLHAISGVNLSEERASRIYLRVTEELDRIREKFLDRLGRSGLDGFTTGGAS